jgi:hypothetical protein
MSRIGATPRPRERRVSNHLQGSIATAGNAANASAGTRCHRLRTPDGVNLRARRLR